jgi:UDP-4-amino-4-deoxy-L-arabinose-oxoglutarate aminotransferase
MFVSFYKHQIGEQELNSVKKVFQSEILTTGAEVALFEKKFAEYLNVKHVIGLQSCTAALHLGLEAFNFPEGSEVITTPLTYIATALSILQARLTPVFCDVDINTGNIDIDQIETLITNKTVAVMPVHLYGQMVDVERLKNLCSTYNLKCIEDSAHCVEGSWNSYQPASLSDAACFSFYATKNLTCGEGGCLATNSDFVAKKLRLLRSHGVTKLAYDRHREGYSHWDLELNGWKYNLDNISASILLPQLSQIEDKLARRERLCQHYEDAFSEVSGIKSFKINKLVKHARHLYPIRVPEKQRDNLLQHLKEKNIGSVVNYRSLNNYRTLLEQCKFNEKSFVNALQIGDSVLSLPLYPGLQNKEIEYVTDVVLKFARAHF